MNSAMRQLKQGAWNAQQIASAVFAQAKAMGFNGQHNEQHGIWLDRNEVHVQLRKQAVPAGIARKVAQVVEQNKLAEKIAVAGLEEFCIEIKRLTLESQGEADENPQVRRGGNTGSEWIGLKPLEVNFDFYTHELSVVRALFKEVEERFEKAEGGDADARKQLRVFVRIALDYATGFRGFACRKHDIHEIENGIAELKKVGKAALEAEKQERMKKVEAGLNALNNV